MSGIRRCRLTVAICALVAAAGVNSGAQRDDKQDVEAVRVSGAIAMISTSFGGENTFGAGIILGRRDGSVYVMTANHVVRHGDALGSGVRVRFKQAGERLFNADVLPTFDPRLDVAALRVATAATIVDVCSDAFSMLPIAGVDAFGRGAPVFPVGNPNGAAWVLPVVPDAVAGVTPDRLTFQSTILSPGHSGGALVTPNGTVVGLIVSDAPPFGAAVPIERVILTAVAWGLPVDVGARFRDVRSEGFPAFPEGSEYQQRVADQLRAAARAGDLKTVTQLLDTCHTRLLMDLSWPNPTPLHLAAARGDEAMARLLLAKGARINATDRARRDTPLHVAAAQGRGEIIRLLVAARAPIDVENREGNTPLAVAIKANNGMAELLRSLGAKN